MTFALCFNCGCTKFGALVRCGKCNAAASGNMDLDIAFSDHVITAETIEAFGTVVKAIHRVCDSDSLCFWAFIRYVSVHHPGILRVEQSEAAQQRCDEVLQRADIPAITVTRSDASQRFRDDEARGGQSDA